MEDQNKLLTAKQAREITNTKMNIYKEECEVQAESFLPKVMSAIEKAANNKLGNITFSSGMSSLACVFLCDKLGLLGYKTHSQSQNVRHDFYSIDISW